MKHNELIKRSPQPADDYEAFEMTTKEEIIQAFSKNEQPLRAPMKRATLRAMVDCLESEDKCSIHEREFCSTFEIRDAVLRNLSKDKNIGKSKYYKALINRFLKLLNESNGKSCQAIGYCLSNLVNSSPKQFKNKITIELLKNRYLSNRQRGYKLVKNSNPNKYLSLIKSCWEKHGDFEATCLIIQNADLLYLQQKKKRLLNFSNDIPWLVGRLYIKLCQNSTDELKELKLIDEITYAYAATILNHSLSAEEANELFINNISDKRIDLLIWCFGKQKLWNVLLALPMPEKYSKICET